MKKLPSIKAILVAIIVICSIEFVVSRLEKVTMFTLDSAFTTSGNVVMETILHKTEKEKLEKEERKVNEVRQEIEIISLKASSPVIVYEGMTLEELGAKLDRSLNSTLSGYGPIFAKYAIEYGVDPYLALSITLLETGCTWNCSSLVKKCNNVGGMKGKGSCNGSSYASFPSLEEGISAMISNLSQNYIQKGLITPEQINTKYATSSTWANKVNYYIEKISNA